MSNCNFEHILTPNEFSECKVIIEAENINNYKTEYKINEDFELVLGMGTTSFDKKINDEIFKMTKGERKEFQENKNDLTEKYSILLKNFNPSKEIFELSVEEMVERGERFKGLGSNSYDKGEIEVAFYFFSRAFKYFVCSEIEIIESEDKEEEKEKNIKQNKTEQSNKLKQKINSLKLSCQLNLALCQSKKGNMDGVFRNSNEVLTKDPNNKKALYRRGQYYLTCKDYQPAIRDLSRLLTLDPNNKVALQTLNQAKLHLSLHNKDLSNKLKQFFK